MTRRRRRGRAEPPGPAGFLVVDKPPGWTSHDVVDAARGWLGTRRVGHLGTLDPQATGVLPLAVREATKLVPFFEGSERGGPDESLTVKVYVGTLRLGVETETQDREGRELRRYDGALPDEATLRKTLEGFVGEIEQVPPMYSAVKHHGVPLHRLARQGQQVERAPRRVHIERIDLRRYTPPDVEVEVECSPGTYLRTLAADAGAELGCGAHLAALCRTRSGPFTLEQALGVDALAREAEAGRIAEHLIPPARGLGLPTVALAAPELRRLGHGGEIDAPAALRGTPLGTRLSALDADDRLVAVVELRADRCLHPVRVLRPADPGA
jgi:tRNA pseudouridine55 synthase